MKYLEVEGAGRLEVEGWRHRPACRGEERLISDLMYSAILELKFEARSLSVGCCRPLVYDFSILG